MCKSDLRYLNYILLNYYLNYCLRLYGMERKRLYGIKVNICYTNHLSIILFWFLIKKPLWAFCILTYKILPESLAIIMRNLQSLKLKKTVRIV